VVTVSASSKKARRGHAAYQRGKRSEFLCRLFLRLKGYRILASRYKTHQGEIDIIALRGKTVAFIEVKARANVHQAAGAVSPQQQARLARTAALFHAHHRGYSKYTMRFDVMLVAPLRWPRHIENAFQAHVRLG